MIHLWVAISQSSLDSATKSITKRRIDSFDPTTSSHSPLFAPRITDDSAGTDDSPPYPKLPNPSRPSSKYNYSNNSSLISTQQPYYDTDNENILSPPQRISVVLESLGMFI